MSDLSIRFDELEDEGFFLSPDSKSKQKEKEKNDSFSRAVKIIFIILSVCVFLEFLFYKFIIPSIEAPVVSVTGQDSYVAEEIVEFLRPMNAQNWFDFNVEQAVSILASVSGIDSVSVKKTFPNKIYIHIEEREPVALTFLTVNDRSVAVQIDKNGVMFQEKGDGAGTSADIPILSGLPVEHMSEGMRIPSKYRALIEQIADIRRKPQKYFAAVSEICVVPKEYGNYELVLIPAKSKIRVLTDRTLNEDSLKYMMVVLDVVNSMEPNVSEIDLRYGSVSYRKK